MKEQCRLKSQRLPDGAFNEAVTHAYFKKGAIWEFSVLRILKEYKVPDIEVENYMEVIIQAARFRRFNEFKGHALWLGLIFAVSLSLGLIPSLDDDVRMIGLIAAPLSFLCLIMLHRFIMR